MIMTGAAGLPSMKTVLVAVRFSGQPSKPATSAASASTRLGAGGEPARRLGRLAQRFGRARAAARPRTARGGLRRADGRRGIAGAASAPAGGASRSAGSAPIASSAPISTYQRSSASAASRSSSIGIVASRTSSGKASSALPFLRQILYSRSREIRRKGDERGAGRSASGWSTTSSIVGAGPSGLAAAIRLKQLAAAAERELGVCVVEKGSEVGAHILSGAVFEPRALDELIPDWREQGAPLVTPATEDRFLLLTKNRALRLPTPPQMHNHGNYIISLGNLCRWLAQQAEALGVEIYPGFAAAEVLYDEAGRVRGVATGDMGIGKDGQPTDRYQPGVELIAPRDAVRRRLPRLADQDADRSASGCATASTRRPMRSASRNCGRSRPTGTSPGWSCTRSAGRSTAAPMAARFSTISKTGRWRSGL